MTTKLFREVSERVKSDCRRIVTAVLVHVPETMEGRLVSRQKFIGHRIAGRHKLGSEEGFTSVMVPGLDDGLPHTLPTHER